MLVPIDISLRASKEGAEMRHRINVGWLRDFVSGVVLSARGKKTITMKLLSRTIRRRESFFERKEKRN